ncbi:MAG: SMC-Scp complex subunit ScpB [Candidatus Paceibacterota bacterium]|jgi:segregation and condensation protein B
MDISSKIEAILFIKGEPVSFKKLADLLEVNISEIKESLEILEKNLESRGLQLIIKEDEVMLGTRKDLSSLLELIKKDELNRELSKASLETLTIILYKEHPTRSDIDYIRGVNSSFILRNLLIRGLIERETHPTDQRKFIYKPTFDLLSYLGLSKIDELPNYQDFQNILTKSAEEISELEQEEI